MCTESAVALAPQQPLPPIEIARPEIQKPANFTPLTGKLALLRSSLNPDKINETLTKAKQWAKTTPGRLITTGVLLGSSYTPLLIQNPELSYLSVASTVATGALLGLTHKPVDHALKLVEKVSQSFSKGFTINTHCTPLVNTLTGLAVGLIPGAAIATKMIGTEAAAILNTLDDIPPGANLVSNLFALARSKFTS